MKDKGVKGEEMNRGVKMNLKEIKKEKTALIEEENRLRKRQKELVKQEKEQKEKEIKQKYSRIIIDTPITWISKPVITRFRKVAISYVSIEPASYTIDEKLNPMNVHSPKTHNSISITLPDVYVKYSGKVRVTIEPLEEEVEVQK